MDTQRNNATREMLLDEGFLESNEENRGMSETEVTATEPATEPKDIVSLEGRAKAWHDSVIIPLQALVTESKGLTIAGHIAGEKEGFKVVRAMRLRIRSNRLPIQNEAKAMKDIARAIVKTVGQYEDELISIIAPEEKRLEREEDAYEAKKAQIERERDELKKRITAARFIQMQELKVEVLDYDLCQTATEATWDMYVDQWTKQKADKDAAAAIAKEKADADADAEAAKLAEADRAAAEKAKEEARLAAVALAAERAENARLKAEIEQIKALSVVAPSAYIIPQEYTQIKVESAPENHRLDTDLNKLNDWRMEIKKAIERVPSPVFLREETQVAFELERAAILADIP